ncbi:signal recognition particle receptor ftsy [Secundilactobacillus kimchicus JCM 15530]|uniref:Signal recognition particle receptor FtsY n=1 Tax=Secundilactobacillus kimchicus JCM 15530 TaxID=1302272 RepID=A0A0R1I038_9LACO|nr:signal recognition particle-docking protein FtsY [Secundilactobacillus kimchicus]KRK49297.1 signal recognition particle receptor ftsy [Secundilactobacillus kimchicus JCM 15530]
MGLFDFFKRKPEETPKSQEPESQSSSQEAEKVASAAEQPASSAASAADLNDSNQAQDSSPASPEKRQPKQETVSDSEVAVPLTSNASQVSGPAQTVPTDHSEATDVSNAAADSEGPNQPDESNASQTATDQSDPSATTAVSEQSTVAPGDTAEASDLKTAATTTTDAIQETSQPETEENRYDKGLTKTRLSFGERLNRLLANFRSVDESFFDDLEETLIGADVGYETAMTITDELRDEVKLQNAKKPRDVQNVVVQKLIDLYNQAGQGESNTLAMADQGPTVVLFVGVNGVGKTTTIGKMANMFKQQGKKVLLAAADTFRAGAIEQLNEWAKRDGVDIVKKPEKSDPSAVVFDAVKKAKAENYDILFVDTAGRLQNKANLMNELAKMKRVITREIPAAPHEVLIVLDATTGQNALNQTKLFKETTDVSGIVLTKLDGTARGGIVLAIRNEMHLPVKYVGLGEKVDDLRPFDSDDFVHGLFKGLVD